MTGACPSGLGPPAGMQGAGRARAVDALAAAVQQRCGRRRRQAIGGAKGGRGSFRTGGWAGVRGLLGNAQVPAPRDMSRGALDRRVTIRP